VDRPDADAPVRLNASVAQLAGLGAAVIAATALFTLWIGPLWGGLVNIVGLLSLVREGAGVDVSRHGVRFWGFLRPRSLSWAQVVDIDTDGNRIHLTTRSGAHVLGAPRRGLVLGDPRFDAKYGFLRRAWERERAGVP
jgi:hypothetical protein